MKHTKLLAILLALLLALGAPVSAMAEEGPINISDGGYTKIEDDITSNTVGLNVYNPGTEADIEGSVIVTGGYTGAYVYDGASANIRDNVTVEGRKDESETVEGITMLNGASVNVGGDAVVTNACLAYGVSSNSGNNAFIGGDLRVTVTNSAAGMDLFREKNNVDVLGEVYVKQEGSSLGSAYGIIANGNNDGFITVGEDLRAEGANAFALELGGSDNLQTEIGGSVIADSTNGSAIGINLSNITNSEINIGNTLEATTPSDPQSQGSNGSIAMSVGDTSNTNITVESNVISESDNATLITLGGSDKNTILIKGDATTHADKEAAGFMLDGSDDNIITVDGYTDASGKSTTHGVYLTNSANNELTFNDGLDVSSDTRALGVVIGDRSLAYDDVHDNIVIIDGDLNVTAGQNSTADGVILLGKNNFVGITGNVDVSGASGNPIYVNGEGNVVAIDGGVTSDTGNFAIYALEGAVYADGIVDADSGVLVYQKGEVTVGGIKADNTAIYAYRGGAVTVNGDVEFGSYATGVYAHNDAKIEITGDLGSADPNNNNAVCIYVEEPSGGAEPEGSFIVRGTLDGEVIIRDSTQDNLLKNLPDIYLHTVESDDGQFISVFDDNGLHDASDDVYKKINYIIDTTDLKHGKITVQGADVMDDGTYYAHEDETITISIHVDSGYKLKNVTGGATLEKAPDGSYILTVPRGGGITIDAIIKAVKTAQAKTDIVLYRDLDILSDRLSLQLVRAINGVDVCGDASSYEEANKFEVIDEDIAAMIKDVENNDLSAVTCELKDGAKVVSQALHLTVNEKKDLTLFLDNAPANATILFYDLTTGEWSTMGSFDGDNLAKVTLPGSGFAFAIA